MKTAELDTLDPLAGNEECDLLDVR